jgi:hypothetical protein
MKYLVMEDGYTTVVREFYYTVTEIEHGEFIILRQDLKKIALNDRIHFLALPVG